MNKIFTFFGLFVFTLGSLAQGIEIYYPDGDVDVSGTTIELSAEDESVHQSFDVKNVSGETLILRIERVKITELEGTQDYLCWGANPETGACYSADFVSPDNPFITPDESALENDARGWLATYHVANGISGCAQYRYYVIDETDTRLDSVDVIYCSTVSIVEETKVEVSVFPNPATDLLNVKLENDARNVSFSLYNVLGEMMVSVTLNKGINKIDLDKLPNGVYFYSIQKNGTVLSTKKLIVKH